MDTIIISEKGDARSFSGRNAVEVYRLAALISAVRLESKGLRIRRGYSATKTAQAELGLKTRDRSILIERLKIKLENAKREVTYIQEGQ